MENSVDPDQLQDQSDLGLHNLLKPVGSKTKDYRNDPKFSDRYACANSADPDQTAPSS